MKRQHVRKRTLVCVASTIGCATLATAFAPGYAFLPQNTTPHLKKRDRRPAIALEMSSISTRPNIKANMILESNSDSTDSATAATKPRIKFGLLNLINYSTNFRYHSISNSSAVPLEVVEFYADSFSKTKAFEFIIHAFCKSTSHQIVVYVCGQRRPTLILFLIYAADNVVFPSRRSSTFRAIHQVL